MFYDLHSTVIIIARLARDNLYFFFTGHLIIPSNTSNTFHNDEWSLTQFATAADPSNHIHNEFHHDDIFDNKISNRTSFRAQNNSIIVSQVGSVVQLPCKAHLVGNETVKSLFPLIPFIYISISLYLNLHLLITKTQLTLQFSFVPTFSCLSLLHVIIPLSKGLLDTKK
jgi:hypothetical protein